MDLSLFVVQRLQELGLDQKDLAEAAQVTESYVSQLLSRKKAPPAPTRTDIYERMERRLRLPAGELSRLATLQRRADLQRELGDEAEPLYREIRTMLLRKCARSHKAAVQAVFERQPYGELERLAIRAMLEATRAVAQRQLRDARGLRALARRTKRRLDEVRVAILELLDTERSAVTVASYATVLDPLVESWDVDLVSLEFRIVLVPGTTTGPDRERRFGFVALPPGDGATEPGLAAFLRDPALSGGATEEEIAFLRRLVLPGRTPTPLYYYRELQNLRDPLHFAEG
jgi:transcriptional regulator with XRE-family HTH domain